LSKISLFAESPVIISKRRRAVMSSIAMLVVHWQLVC
jgi:hypothetical protein